MSGDGSVTRHWGDGEHKFCLRIGELRELEQKRNCGSVEVLLRLGNGKFYMDDVREVLRLGLIGGGAAPPLALGLIAKYEIPSNRFVSVLTAREVLTHSIFGDPEDAVGKLAAEIMGAAPSSEDGPASRPTSEPEPQWDGVSSKSTNAHYGNSPPPSMDGHDATVRARNGSNQ